MKSEKKSNGAKSNGQRAKSATKPGSASKRTTTTSRTRTTTTKTTTTPKTTTKPTATTTETATTELESEKAKESNAAVSELSLTEQLLKTMAKSAMLSLKRAQEEREWQEYLSCGTLPNGKCIRALNTYLALWRESSDTDTTRTMNKAEEALDIMVLLERAIDEEDGSDGFMGEQRMLIFREMKDLLRSKLDYSTYKMLREVSANTDAESGEFRQLVCSARIGLGLWATSAASAAAAAAAGQTSGRRAGGAALGADFADLGCHLELPPALMAAEPTAMRVLKADYDHFSKTCSSSRRPKSDNLRFDLDADLGEILAERLDKNPAFYKEEVRRRYEEFRLKGLDEHELNLRRFVVLGGVCYFDLLQVPPQPRRVAKWTLCQVEPEQKLRVRSWEAEYKAPSSESKEGSKASSKKTPEELEQELKQQELELQKLIRLRLKLSSKCLWFEPPILVRWDDSKNHWTTKGFVDAKFDESAQIMSFRSTRTGIFGLAAFRFPNLPLQSWEMRPRSKSAVNIVLAAASVQADFEIGANYVQLTKLQGGAKCDSLQALYDSKLSLNELILRLRQIGLDLFPEADSHCYIEGLPLKDLVSEHHLYRCMALVSNDLEFAWSRWNLLAGPDRLVLQFKLCNNDEGQQHQVVLVTPRDTNILVCTEASQTFGTEVIEHGKFADLHHLALGVGAHVEAEAELVHTLYSFLRATRLISYA